MSAVGKFASDTVKWLTKNISLRDSEAAKGNTSTVTRYQIEDIQNELSILQDRKMALEQEEMQLKTRFYNNFGIADIENMRADAYMTVPPVQAITPRDVGFQGPDQVVAWERNRAERASGITAFKSAIERIDAELRSTQAQIRDNTQRLNELNQQVAKNDNKSSGITSVEIQKDRIARSRVASLIYLKQLSDLYRSDTTFNGERKWPQDDYNKTNRLMILRQTFTAHAQSFPELKLDTNDPGSTVNKAILEEACGFAQKASGSEKVSAEVKKFVSSQSTTLQDTNRSSRIRNKDDAVPSPDVSMSGYNSTYPAAMVGLWGIGSPNPIYYSSWTLGSIKDSVLDWIRKKTADAYQGLPTCNPPELTPAEQEKVGAEAKSAATRTKGEEAFEKSSLGAPMTTEEINAELKPIWDDVYFWADRFSLFTKVDSGGTLTIYGQQVKPATYAERQWLTLLSTIDATVASMAAIGKATAAQQKVILDGVISYIRTTNGAVLIL